MEIDEFNQGRATWLEWVAQRVCPSKLGDRISSLTDKPHVERAMIVLHVGVGHIYGLADAEITLPGACSEVDVEALISTWWRGGFADPLTSSELTITWMAFLQIGRDLGLISTELLEAIVQSEVASRMRPETTQDLGTSVADAALLARVVNSAPAPIRASTVDADFSWECDGSHLHVVRALVNRDGPAALYQVLTYLEITAALPSSKFDLWKVEALKSARLTSHVYLSIPGSWPGPNGNDIPDWVRDVVVVRGGRSYQSSAGFVPGWLLVATTDAELSAMNRWAYQGGVGLDLSSPERLTFVVRMEFGENDFGYIEYTYQLDDRQLLNWLRTMLAVGVLRVELYRLDVYSRLIFVATFGFGLPSQLVSSAYEHVVQYSPPDDRLITWREPTSRDWLRHLGQIERAFFENLTVAVPALNTDSPLDRAFQEHLRTIHITARDHFRGSLVDEPALVASRQELETQITKSPRVEFAAAAIENLGANRALVQFMATVDAPMALRANAAFLEGDLVVAETFEFSTEIDLSTTWESLDELAAYLANGLVKVGDFLRSHGVQGVVISSGAGVYNVPFHEAFMSMGFVEASYSHRIATLAPKARAAKPFGALVRGHAGDGAQRIPAVDTELAIVRAVGGEAPGDLFGVLPEIVHLAGHAQTGSRDFEVGLLVSGGSEAPLTSAQVLLEVDASSTEIVFLSACSSGAGKFPIGEVIGAIPLDVAFIEKGAKVVISTSDLIGDQIACIFATVFHSSLSQGMGVWDSYIESREAVRAGSIGAHHTELLPLLSRLWPDWAADIARRNQERPGEWRLFRVSGRFWD